MACCILAAIILMYLLAPVRFAQRQLYPLIGKEDPVRTANDAAGWKPRDS